jgi:hypothetical protein
MPSLDRILHADLMRIVVPKILLKGLIGYAMAGVLLAVVAPALHRRGILLHGWMAWGTILLMIAICIAPDLYRRYRRRGGKTVA